MGRKGWWTKEQKSERWEMEVNRTPGEGSVKRERERERASTDKESFSQRTPEVLGKQGSGVRVGRDVKRGVAH